MARRNRREKEKKKEQILSKNLLPFAFYNGIKESFSLPNEDTSSYWRACTVYASLFQESVHRGTVRAHSKIQRSIYRLPVLPLPKKEKKRKSKLHLWKLHSICRGHSEWKRGWTVKIRGIPWLSGSSYRGVVERNRGSFTARMGLGREQRNEV